MKSTETFIDVRPMAGEDGYAIDVRPMNEGWDDISKDVDYAGWPCNRVDSNPIRL